MLSGRCVGSRKMCDALGSEMCRRKNILNIPTNLLQYYAQLNAFVMKWPVLTLQSFEAAASLLSLRFSTRCLTSHRHVSSVIEGSILGSIRINIHTIVNTERPRKEKKQ